MNDVQTFFDSVMLALGREGWTLRWTKGDAYCWRGQKIIDICRCKSVFETKQLLLHEIAHIGENPGHGNQHTPAFFAHLEYLSIRFMGVSLGPAQRRFKGFYIKNETVYKPEM